MLRRFTDNTRWLAPVIFGLQLADFVSDGLFVTELCVEWEKHPALATAAMVFLLLPMTMNLVALRTNL